MGIQAGSCASYGLQPILDAATCNAAAFFLNLPDVTASFTRGRPRPEGCYILQGQFLLLATDRANAGQGAVGPREPICRATSADFKIVSNGTCALHGMDPVDTLAACEKASAELGLADRTASFVFAPGRPRGCFIKGILPGSSLFLSVNPRNSENGADGERELICKVRAEDAENAPAE